MGAITPDWTYTRACAAALIGTAAASRLAPLYSSTNIEPRLLIGCSDQSRPEKAKGHVASVTLGLMPHIRC